MGDRQTAPIASDPSEAVAEPVLTARKPNLARAAHEWPLGLLLTLQLVLWWRPLFSGTFFYRDIHVLFYPWADMLAGMIRAGLPPFWDSFRHGGTPFLANLNPAVLYPANLLLAILPPVAAFNLVLVGHLALVAVGGYALARSLRLSPRAALVTGLALELQGAVLSLPNLTNRLTAFPYLPLLLACWVLYRRSHRRRWFSLAAVCGALMMLAGFPELVVFTFAWLTLWAFVDEDTWQARTRAVAGVVSLAAISFCLAAVQLLPTAALVMGGRRGAGLAFPEFSAFSVHPRRLPELVLPGFFGRNDTITDAAYWGYVLEDTFSPYLLNFYVGATVALLATFGAFARRGTIALRRRTVLLLTVTTVACIVLSLGRNLPGFHLLYLAFPPAHLFRFPVKAIIFAALPIALLAGAGADRLVLDSHQLGRRALLTGILAAVTLALAASAVLYANGSPWAAAFHASYFRVPLEAASRAGMARSLGHAAAALVASGALLLGLAGRRRRWSALAAAALVTVDLWALGYTLNPVADRALLATEPPLAERVRLLVGDGVLFREQLPPAFLLATPANDVEWQTRWEMATLTNCMAANYRIPVIFHIDIDGMPSREIVELGNRLLALPWPRRLPILAAAGVTAALTPERLDLPGVKLVEVLPSLSTAPLRIYRIEGSARHARWTGCWRPVASTGEALDLVSAAGSDTLACPAIVTSLQPATDPAGTGTIRTVSARPDREELELDATGPGMLVLTTPFYQGWQTTIDGASANVLRANGAFQAVAVPAGHHTVTRRFTPPGLLAGAIVTSLAALALAAWTVAGRRRRLSCEEK